MAPKLSRKHFGSFNESWWQWNWIGRNRQTIIRKILASVETQIHFIQIPFISKRRISRCIQYHFHVDLFYDEGQNLLNHSFAFLSSQPSSLALHSLEFLFTDGWSSDLQIYLKRNNDLESDRKKGKTINCHCARLSKTMKKRFCHPKKCNNDSVW